MRYILESVEGGRRCCRIEVEGRDFVHLLLTRRNISITLMIAEALMEKGIVGIELIFLAARKALLFCIGYANPDRVDWAKYPLFSIGLWRDGTVRTICRREHAAGESCNARASVKALGSEIEVRCMRGSFSIKLEEWRHYKRKLCLGPTIAWLVEHPVPSFLFTYLYVA